MSQLFAQAQAPQKIAYQAVARNASGTVLPNQTVTLRFSLRNASSNGTIVYQETQTATTSNIGLFNVNIGEGTVSAGTFAGIDWSNGAKFMQVELDPQGSNTFIDMGTQQMLSVPYALYAEQSGYATGGGNFSHFIGEIFGGGVIFHLWKDAQGIEHGLIVDIGDLDTLSFWSNISSLIGPSAQSLWDGLNNSNAIVSQPGHTSSAALQCLNSSNGGQDDWYLPAIDEMSLLWQNRFNVNKSLSTIPGATLLKNLNHLDQYAYYYTSNETRANEILFYNFYFGYLEFNEKAASTNFTKTRAIRAF
ncbi:MAG: hypothetical protein ACK4YG_09980 [Bacteroidota bacterium]|jgi:hypothetical protein